VGLCDLGLYSFYHTLSWAEVEVQASYRKKVTLAIRRNETHQEIQRWEWGRACSLGIGDLIPSCQTYALQVFKLLKLGHAFGSPVWASVSEKGPEVIDSFQHIFGDQSLAIDW
jgi:hypothetical protein